MKRLDNIKIDNICQDSKMTIRQKIEWSFILFILIVGTLAEGWIVINIINLLLDNY